MTTAPHILAVCTGNICRSPAIERLLSFYLSRSCRISSAGTGAVVGAPIASPMAAHLHSRHVSTSKFAARQITTGLIDDADLIVTATREHRSTVVALQPLAMRYTFTLKEFAHSAASADLATLGPLSVAERLTLLTEHAYKARPRMHLTGAQMDIPDPFQGTDEIYEVAFDMIFKAVSTIVYQLTAK
ncbi:MAG: hypothetical protein FWF25_03645 [Propionibacteriaceae bacterium]|nr:hypothetical protein [Propionibacteriaceae bacterium]